MRSFRLSLLASSVLGVSIGFSSAFPCFTPPMRFCSIVAFGFENHARSLGNSLNSCMPSARFTTRNQLRMSVSKEELTPGSEQMKARAQKAIQKMGKQFLTPLEAANLLAGDKNDLLASPQGAAADEDDEVLFIDVRTPQQRADHEILPGGIKVQLNLHARFTPYGSRQAIPPKRKHAPMRTPATAPAGPHPAGQRQRAARRHGGDAARRAPRAALRQRRRGRRGPARAPGAPDGHRRALELRGVGLPHRGRLGA